VRHNTDAGRIFVDQDLVWTFVRACREEIDLWVVIGDGDGEKDHLHPPCDPFPIHSEPGLCLLQSSAQILVTHGGDTYAVPMLSPC